MNNGIIITNHLLNIHTELRNTIHREEVVRLLRSCLCTLSMEACSRASTVPTPCHSALESSSSKRHALWGWHLVIQWHQAIACCRKQHNSVVQKLSCIRGIEVGGKAELNIKGFNFIFLATWLRNKVPYLNHCSNESYIEIFKLRI